MSKPAIPNPAALASAAGSAARATPQKPDRRKAAGPFVEEEKSGGSSTEEESLGQAVASSGDAGDVTFGDSGFDEEGLLSAARNLMRSSPPKDFRDEELERLLAEGASAASAGDPPSSKVISGIFKGNRSGVRPSTSLGKRQGHHVTAYGMLNKVIRSLFEEASDDDKELRDRRAFLFKIVNAVATIAYESGDRDILGSAIGNIKGAVDNYVEKREDILGAEYRIIKRLKHNFADSADIKTEVEDVVNLTNGSKNFYLVPLISATSGFLLEVFNQTTGVTYPTVNNVDPIRGEGARVAEALKFLEAAFPLEERVRQYATFDRDALDAAAGSGGEAAAASGRGGEAAAASSGAAESEVFRHRMVDGRVIGAVSNLFFYPRVPDDMLFSPKTDEELIYWQRDNKLSDRAIPRDNSDKNLYRAVARHCFLTSEIYPQLDSEEFIIDFSVKIARDWGKEGDDMREMIEGVRSALEELKAAESSYQEEVSPAKVAPTPFRTGVRIIAEETSVLNEGASEMAIRDLTAAFAGIPVSGGSSMGGRSSPATAVEGGRGPRTVAEVSGIRAAGLSSEVSSLRASSLGVKASVSEFGKTRE